jgi:Kef-type K+ transport system membrane component KefB
MEVFVDFGLFELLAAAGLAIVARRVYMRRWSTLACLTLSLVTPVLLVFFAHESLLRWIAVICLGTTLINCSFIFLLMRRWDMSMLLDKAVSSAKKP